MDERDIIMVAGMPGSGKSTQAAALTRLYNERLNQHPADSPASFPHLASQHSPHLAAHISLGQYVRNIASGHVDSFYTEQIKSHLQSHRPHELLDDELASRLVQEALLHFHDARLVFVDGYPRRDSQVQDIITIASNLDYRLAGMLVMDIDIETAKARCLKRARGLGGASFSKMILETIRAKELLDERFDMYQASMPDTLSAVERVGLPVEHIPTDGPKETTLHLGRVAIDEYLLHRDDGGTI